MKNSTLILASFIMLFTTALLSSCTHSDINETFTFKETSRIVQTDAVDIIFKTSPSNRVVYTSADSVSYYELNIVADEIEYDVTNCRFSKDESYCFVAKKDFSAFVSIAAFDETNNLLAHGSKSKSFKTKHSAEESNVLIELETIYKSSISDYTITPIIHDSNNIHTEDVLDYWRYNQEKNILSFDSKKGPYYQIDLTSNTIISCTSSGALIKYVSLAESKVTLDLYSDELPYIYEYVFDLNDTANQSAAYNTYGNNHSYYEASECTHEILSGENYVTISTNGITVAQVILPTEKYGACDIIWTSLEGLTCEGQIINSNKYAISTYINGAWQQNKHENWESPSFDSAGYNLSGSGEGGSCYYNFRYSIETTLGSTTGIVNSTKLTTITRTGDSATTECEICGNYFDFDFSNGAHFRISFEGKILHTSECNPIAEYSETFGVDIKNFEILDSTIEFDLLDGEYSSSKYEHYSVSLTFPPKYKS